MRGGGIAAGHGHIGHLHVSLGQKRAAAGQSEVVHVAHRGEAQIAVEEPLDLAARQVEVGGAAVKIQLFFDTRLKIGGGWADFLRVFRLLF